ncbi:MAG TPA: hypothetical protein VG317_22345 [Pseudonocardiaceae bacterium]|nr:hypothetical protein [Pseudonocardiaceae bacterium]
MSEAETDGLLGWLEQAAREARAEIERLHREGRTALGQAPQGTAGNPTTEPGRPS